jgi:hypothetical protein
LKAIGTVKEDFEMFDKYKNKNAKKVIVASQKEADDHPIHISDLDDGEFAFMEWLNSENKTTSKIILYLKDMKKIKNVF